MGSLIMILHADTLGVPYSAYHHMREVGQIYTWSMGEEGTGWHCATANPQPIVSSRPRQ